MFLSKLRNCVNIYDVMILCFEQIKSKQISKLIGSYCPQEYSEYAGFVSQYVEESETSPLNAMSNLISNIEASYQKKNFCFYEFYTIIQTIDDRCEYNGFDVFYGEFIQYEGINTIHDYGSNVIPIIKNTVIDKYNKYLKIYEKSCGKRTTGFRKRQKQNNGDINDYLNNYIIINENPYKVMVYSINEHFNFFSNSVNNAIDIINVPVINSKTNEIFEVNIHEHKIQIKGVKEKYCTQVKDIYKRAIEKSDGCDLLIFPELFFTGMDIEEIRSMILQNDFENDTLIVLGSYCEDGNNKSMVITSNGTLLFEQHKKTTYIENGNFEDLSKSDNIINIVDVVGIGRICVVICKDILNDYIKRYIKVLNVDIILVVSYSPSLDMKSASEELSKTCQCISVMCNSCSAIKPGIESSKKIGYITIPAKQDTYSDYHTEFYTNENCLICNMCAGHRLNIKYDEINLYNDNKIRAKIFEVIEKRKKV